MPIYDYRCPQCQAVFERLVSYSKAGEVACPQCGHRYAQRRVSKIAVRTSGSSENAGTSCSDGYSSGGG
jgi:putative FmdB family regulatory protein